jgi:hypothetical protein
MPSFAYSNVVAKGTDGLGVVASDDDLLVSEDGSSPLV